MNILKSTSLVLSLSLAISPVILAGGDKETYKPSLATIQERSSSEQPKTVKAPAGAVRVLPALPVVRTTKPETRQAATPVVPAAQPATRPVVTAVVPAAQAKVTFAKPTVAADRQLPSTVSFAASTKQSQDKAETKKSQGSLVKGFVKLAVAVGAGWLSYEFFQQGHKQNLLRTAANAVGLDNSFGARVEQGFYHYQPRLVKIRDEDKPMVLKGLRFGAASLCGAVALTAGISGVKDLIK